MILAVTISAIIMAFLPFAFLRPGKKRAKMEQQPQPGPQADIETVAYRLLTDKKQQQPVPEQFVRPVLAYGNTIAIVEERMEFEGNKWILAGAAEIKNALLLTEILQRPVCAN